jgi:hypothetical protein
MESKELFYILLIIILILNLLNKTEPFLNLSKTSKNNVNKCCEKNCHLTPKYLRDKNCEKNKIKNKNNIKKQQDSKFKNLQDFYDKRPKFELEPLGDNKPLVEQPERQERLLTAIKKKEYLPAYNSINNFVKNSGKPSFYIK